MCRKSVDISTERPMQKPHPHPWLYFFKGDCFIKVRSNAPILFRRVDDLIVDPPTVGGLQEWMVEEKREPTTWS